MPTKRIPISRFSTALNAAQLAFLHGSPLPDDVGPVEFVEYAVLTAGHRAADNMPLQGRPNARRLWEEHGAAVLAVWIGAKPGTRPPGWWKIEAQPRLRLGGIGEPWTQRDMWSAFPLFGRGRCAAIFTARASRPSTPAIRRSTRARRPICDALICFGGARLAA